MKDNPIFRAGAAVLLVAKSPLFWIALAWAVFMLVLFVAKLVALKTALILFVAVPVVAIICVIAWAFFSTDWSH